jgi:hypothetical protein
VLRLTLLFFGAAKDVPEAAKWSPPGQPAHISKCKPMAKRDATFTQLHDV